VRVLSAAAFICIIAIAHDANGQRRHHEWFGSGDPTDSVEKIRIDSLFHGGWDSLFHERQDSLNSGGGINDSLPNGRGSDSSRWGGGDTTGGGNDSLPNGRWSDSSRWGGGDTIGFGGGYLDSLISGWVDSLIVADSSHRHCGDSTGISWGDSSSLQDSLGIGDTSGMGGLFDSLMYRHHRHGDQGDTTDNDGDDSGYQSIPGGNGNGYGKIANAVSPSIAVLSQNYPNPFNGVTTLEYTLPQEGMATLTVYTASGHVIATLSSGVQTAGVHQTTFNGATLPNGTYIYRLQTSAGVMTKTMIAIR
jgi:hypothetical protein